MDEQERTVQVRQYYRALGQGVREFDGSREAWLWNELLDQRDETLIEDAARIIEVYTEIGSYPSSGEHFHQLAEFMASLRWLTWGGEEELKEFFPPIAPL